MSHDPTISQDADDLNRARLRSSQRVRPPLEVAGFDFERFLGAGAYGEVWVAVDRNTGRRVAVKFYTHRGGVDWSLLAREVEKLAFLFADRYVVQLIDVGWDANPPYYVMEYLERGSLADRLQNGAIPAAEAVSLFRDIAIGLVHAHDKGVLHCDLKPGNVLLDSDHRPRLADFGQSRLSHEQTPALGTLFYMAPEQADLNAVPDARWDVYALGALLYCMLVGEPPHRTSEIQAEIEKAGDLTTKLATYRRLLQRAPSPTKHRPLPGVDRDLEEIIDRCLQPTPQRRYPNPQAVLVALDARTLRKSRRPLLVLGAIGPAVLLAVLSWFAWSAYHTAVRESDATLVTRSLETNDFAARFVAQAVAAEIERRWHVLEREADDVELRELLTKATDAPKIDAAAQTLVQKILQETANAHPDVEAASWTVLDARGNQLARIPFDKKTVGQNYAFRDYFHGRGDLPEGTKAEPIRAAHLSNVFVSTATNDRKVAFSCPLWSTEDDRSKRRVVGVLSVTVTLGKFAELRAPEGSERSQVAALVDVKPDSTKRAGSLLEHPHLAELLRNKKPSDPFPAVYFDEARLAKLREAVDPKRTTGVSDTDYRDPVGSPYDGRWLAAVRPVVVAGRDDASRSTGWVVVVQEPHDQAVGPAQALGQKLVRSGLIALGIVIGVVTALWGFVVIVLNESPRFGIGALIKRRAGLPQTGLTSGGSSVAVTASTPTPHTTRDGKKD